MKSITKLSLVLLTAMAFAAFPAHAQSDSTAATTNAPAPRPRPSGFNGVVTAVDATAMTITIKGRRPGATDVTVKVTSDTRMTKNRQPAVFADIKEGLRVAGAGKKQDDGTWVATTMRISTAPLPQPGQAPTPAAPPSSTEQK